MGGGWHGVCREGRDATSAGYHNRGSEKKGGGAKGGVCGGTICRKVNKNDLKGTAEVASAVTSKATEEAPVKENGRIDASPKGKKRIAQGGERQNRRQKGAANPLSGEADIKDAKKKQPARPSATGGKRGGSLAKKRLRQPLFQRSEEIY